MPKPRCSTNRQPSPTPLLISMHATMLHPTQPNSRELGPSTSRTMRVLSFGSTASHSCIACRKDRSGEAYRPHRPAVDPRLEASRSMPGAQFARLRHDPAAKASVRAEPSPSCGLVCLRPSSETLARRTSRTAPERGRGGTGARPNRSCRLSAVCCLSFLPTRPTNTGSPGARACPPAVYSEMVRVGLVWPGLPRARCDVAWRLTLRSHEASPVSTSTSLIPPSLDFPHPTRLPSRGQARTPPLSLASIEKLARNFCYSDCLEHRPNHCF